MGGAGREPESAAEGDTFGLGGETGGHGLSLAPVWASDDSLVMNARIEVSVQQVNGKIDRGV